MTPHKISSLAQSNNHPDPSLQPITLFVLTNIYATAGKWEGVDNVRSLADSKGLKKDPGWSYIELNNKMEVFYIGNYSHPQCDEIYEKLDELLGKMKILGYVPDYSFVLQDVEEDEKQHILTSHNERLAIVYGILNTPPKTTNRIFKNLREPDVIKVLFLVKAMQLVLTEGFIFLSPAEAKRISTFVSQS
ncbi:pentatricopeptide repeat-containing protein [Tanacetum coccineum]|uniref:Pentatricopeptide repeat-containing protein n=1 Tax=Tanacetum coccineum TaxID=301880 RepID=A0ABQ5ARL4_9ASTR